MTMWIPSLPPRSESSGAPLYRAIARALEEDVRSGVLGRGERLPTHRDLALRLGVNVGTVSRAYGECERAGWIRGEVGRGTFVGGSPAPSVGESFVRGRTDAAETIDLGLNVPVPHPAPDLPAALRALALEIEQGVGKGAGQSRLLGYEAPEGSAADREAGAQALRAHGLEVAADRVVVCAGGQHGLAVGLATFCRPGDAVAVEELTYPGFRAVAEARDLRIEAVAVDADGIVPESFAEVCARSRPRALYLSPTLQNPTTSTLPLARREAIAEIATRYDVGIVEDDVHRMLAPEEPPPLAHLAPERSIYVATLSKSLAPSLRVAYLAVPRALYERVVEQVWGTIWMVSPVCCALASGWVRDGTFERVAAGRREEARARQALAGEVLASLPADFRLRSAPTAYHAWLELGGSWNATSFANAARARGVIVTPAETFHLGPGAAPRAVRLSLSGAADRASLARGLEIVLAIARGDSGASRAKKLGLL